MSETGNKKAYNLAAIDIGSNAARILIKKVEITPNGIHMKKLQFLRIPLRLGIDVFTDGFIGKEREKMLLRTMKVFRQLLYLYEVDEFEIFATSAFRDAENSDSIIDEVKRKTKLEIKVISGEEEAKIIHDNFHSKGNLLYMDVGGGSTELSLVCDGQLKKSCSVNIGTIRLLKETVSSAAWDNMIEKVKDISDGIDNIQIVGSGGNINKLIRLVYKNEKKRTEMSVVALNNIYKKMSNMSVPELIDTFDLTDNRADVIVPAAQIFTMVAFLVGAHTILVPNVGLADGMINLMAEKLNN